MTERAPQPTGWLLVRRYADEPTALKTFEAARDLLFTQDLDASVLRFSINRTFHVAVIGESPLSQEASGAVNEVLELAGEPVELPPFAADELRERRQQFKESGIDYWERRTALPPPET